MGLIHFQIAQTTCAHAVPLSFIKTPLIGLGNEGEAANFMQVTQQETDAFPAVFTIVLTRDQRSKMQWTTMNAPHTVDPVAASNARNASNFKRAIGSQRFR